jgi:ABC-type nitrate/sulfonate/bicarbonate transport system substrate-binding protein
MARNTSAPVSAGFGRRRLLIRGLQAGGLAAVAGPVLAACSGSSSSSGSAAAPAAASSSSGAAPDLGALSCRLSWIKNVEFAGSYIADARGYDKAEGLSAEGLSAVNLIGGDAPAAPMEADVAAGTGDLRRLLPRHHRPAILTQAELVKIG